MTLISQPKNPLKSPTLPRLEGSIREKADTIRRIIEENRTQSPLSNASVRLMAASKLQSREAIEEAIAADILWFGENRVQEAQEKWPDIRRAYPNVRLHLIGPLQTNKVRDALALFDAIESIDREKLVDAIKHTFDTDKGGSLITSAFYIQINTGEEPQKGGVAPKQAAHLIHYAKQAGLNVVGLMCIPPANHASAPHFALLRNIAKEHGLSELSMGMSEDFHIATRFGATHVRVGSALFGER